MLTSEQIAEIDWKKGDGLVPAVVQCAHSARVLMLGYLNSEALAQTLETRRVTFYSRSKSRLWTKGESSGHFLQLVDCFVDCDRDTLLLIANPIGPTCHNGTETCFDGGFANLHDVIRIIGHIETHAVEQLVLKENHRVRVTNCRFK